MTEDHVVNTIAKKQGWKDIKIERRSEKMFDLTVEGFDPEMGCKFSAWLPLACIRYLTMWTSHKIAMHTDYPEMAIEGDWSGVRDSSTDSIWFIFDNFVLK